MRQGPSETMYIGSAQTLFAGAFLNKKPLGKFLLQLFNNNGVPSGEPSSIIST